MANFLIRPIEASLCLIWQRDGRQNYCQLFELLIKTIPCSSAHLIWIHGPGEELNKLVTRGGFCWRAWHTDRGLWGGLLTGQGYKRMNIPIHPQGSLTHIYSLWYSRKLCPGCFSWCVQHQSITSNNIKNGRSICLPARVPRYIIESRLYVYIEAKNNSRLIVSLWIIWIFCPFI